MLCGGTKLSAFLLAGALQQLQVVGEGVEGNAEEELQLLRWAGPIVPELPREFTSPSLGLGLQF